MDNSLSISRNLMGSPFTIKVYPGRFRTTESELRKYLEIVYGEVARIEAELTDFKPSPFNEINRFAGIRAVEVSDEIFTLIFFAQQLARDSESAFDITYAAIGSLWREAFKKKTPLPPDLVAGKRHLVNFRHVQLDERRNTIFLPDREMRISLGGIGKGYAVDQAHDLLLRLGVGNFMINGAGDIRVASSAGAVRPWRIGIRNPLTSKLASIGVIALSQVAGKKIVVLNFWAAWCTTCKEEIPQLEAFKEKLDPEDTVFLGVNAGDKPAKAGKFQARYDYPYTILIDRKKRWPNFTALQAFPKP